MAMEMRHLMICFFGLLFLASMAAAVPGTASFYAPPYVPTACYGNRDPGILIAAASDVIWGGRSACGKRYSVRCVGAVDGGVSQPCKNGTVVVTIVDYCPRGCPGTMDLSREAFNTIANPRAGLIRIEYQEVN